MQAYIMPLSVNNVIMARVDYLYFAGASCSGMSQTLDEGCTISDDCSTITGKIKILLRSQLHSNSSYQQSFSINTRTICLRYGKTGNKKHATCLATLPQNELNSDVARFTTHIKPVLQQIRLLTGLTVGGKTCNIAIQLVLQQCYKTSCTFFVARFSIPLRI